MHQRPLFPLMHFAGRFEKYERNSEFEISSEVLHKITQALES